MPAEPESFPKGELPLYHCPNRNESRGQKGAEWVCITFLLILCTALPLIAYWHTYNTNAPGVILARNVVPGDDSVQAAPSAKNIAAANAAMIIQKDLMEKTKVKEEKEKKERIEKMEKREKEKKEQQGLKRAFWGQLVGLCFNWPLLWPLALYATSKTLSP